MRTKHRIDHRIIALFMAVAVLFTSMRLAGSLLPIVAAAGENVIIRDDALHFIIRHWHTDYDEEANHQGGQQEEGDENNYFVLLEGYIIPKTEDEKEYKDDNFTIVLVNQATGALVKASTLYDDNDYNDPTTPYLGALDKENGVIEIMVKPLRDKNMNTDSGYDNLENFSGFSMSAGRGAVSYIYDKYEGEGDEQTGVKGTEAGIRITYSKYTHLVKGHFFYSSWTKTVPGTNDPTVFDPNNEEIDTAEVYTWIESVNGHMAGEIVKYTDAENDAEVACKTEEDLAKVAEREGLTLDELKAAVTLTKFYSTNEGLHTNKTLKQLGDGRLFLSDLEAWYVEGYAPQLGFILDASGGMAFPSDKPTIINVYSALLDQLRTLGVSKNSAGKYVYKGKEYDDPKALFQYLEKLEGVGHTAIVKALTEVVERTVTEEDVHGLLDKIGELEKQNNDGIMHTIYEYPQRDKMVGYYEFVGNNAKATGAYEGYRTWGLNNVDANVANSSEFEYADFNESYFTKMVTQGPEAGGFDFSEWQPMYNGFPNQPLNFSNNTGFNIGSTKTTAGVLLNKTPTGSFTLSFSSDVNTTSDTAEILYIGPPTGAKSSAAFRMTSESGSFNIYSGGNNVWTAEASGNTRFTLVYNGSSLAIYLGSTLNQTVNLSLSDSNIVFAPFSDDNTSDLYVDDVFLYESALKGNEVRQLVTAYDNKKGINDSTTAAINWNDIFIDEDALMLLLNPHNTVHTPLGVAAYNYYVGPIGSAPLGYWEGEKSSKDSVESSALVIKTNENVTLGTAYKTGGRGWYFVTHTGNENGVKDLLGEVGSAKNFIGLSKNLTVTDSIDGANANTGVSYTVPNEGPTRFYLDSEGNLRCFYSSARGGIADNLCSYVYMLEDSQYVKTEALQRVLANFTTKLTENSPSSQISAVRFSSDAFANVKSGTEKIGLESLVLLDWTDDPVEVSKMMSQVRGDGTARLETGYDMSAAGVKQYNYALTGATYVYTGLQAFYDTLIMDGQNNRRDDENAPKFVVIFTDGDDNDASYDSATGKLTIGDKTLKAVKDVKDKGYTIITVYTPEAGVTPENYAKAKAFLTTIAGTKNATDGEDYFFESTNLEELERIFNEQLLAQLTSKVEGYTVQDYIDPRFDLQNADGTVWKLKANGLVDKIKNGVKVETIDVTQKNKKTNDYYTFHLAGSSTPSARDPYLLYDGDKDMYYLKWVDQTIPSSAVGAKDLLPVWNAEVMLRAKDDFIGGNTILINGNREEMNWLYHPADLSEEAYNEYYKDWDEDTNGPKNISDYYASSGTQDMYKQYNKTIIDGKEVNDYNDPIDEFPSKGFPRVVANVKLLSIDTIDQGDVIYLGEAISPRQLLTEINGDCITDSYYLDYLKRYAYQRYISTNDPDKKSEMEMPLLELMRQWLDIGNDDAPQKEFSVPYMYLPSVQYDDKTGKIVSNGIKANNTGTAFHERDVIGILTYRWEQLDPDPINSDEPIKDFVKNNTEQIKYSLTVEFTPLRVGDDLETLNAAVPQTTSTTAYGTPIVAAEETEAGAQKSSRARDGIFAKYIPIVGDKTVFGSTFLFDRESYVNDRLIQDKDDAYSWDKTYKPEVYDEQVLYPEGSEEGGLSSYGSATFLNSGRTLTAFSESTQSIISGGLVLEMKMLIGELRESLDSDGGLHGTFTLTATRSFTDTDSAEKAKKEQSLTDFSRVTDSDTGAYTFTFEFNYTAAQIADLETDENGYVRVFATATDVKAKFGNTVKQVLELPIGSYTFSMEEANTNNPFANIHFGSITSESDTAQFKDAYSYFNARVRDGLNATNETPEQKLREVEADGEKGPVPDPEITKDNIQNYIAEAKSSKETVTFYIGTSEKTSPKRGSTTSPENLYTNDRLGIIQLSTGTTRLTVKEVGGQKNESFLYRVTGKTYGDKPVDLIISVEGGKFTTIDILPGEYTVTEISNWSWRYQNDKTEAPDAENWTISTDWKEAKTTLWHQNDDPIEQSKTVTYYHTRNDKVWLGGENHKNNQFAGVATPDEE